MIVVDSSFLLSRLLEDPRAGYVRQVMEAAPAPFHAPSLLAFEVTHVLSRRHRLGHLTLAERDAALAVFSTQLLEFDERPERAVLQRTLEHAERLNLSGYDAAYLELALRKGSALATLDADLANAGRAVGLTVHHTAMP